MDQLTIATLGLASATVVLAILTGLYFYETRLMRKLSQKPSFAIEPTLYTLGGTFHRLILVNTGQTANEIRVELSWGKNAQDVLIRKYYILSLSKNGRAYFEDLPISSIVDGGNILFINLSCKDILGKDSNQKLQYDFSTLVAEDRKFLYQASAEETV